MIVGRILGWLITLAAVLILGAELVGFVRTGAYKIISGGELWSDIDLASLNFLQAVIQRYIHPMIWDPVLIAVLRAPAWVPFGVVGMGISWLCRKRRKKRNRRNRRSV